MREPGRKTGTYGRSFGPVHLEGAVSALGAEQHAVFRLDQLAALGLSSDLVRKRAAAGRMHRIYPTVYSLVPRSLLTREGHWMAAVLACGPGAVLSHRDAAALHGMRPTSRTRIDVTVPGRSGRRRSGIDIHRSRTLTPGDVTVENRIPCTTVARTALDLAAVSPRRVIERALDQLDAMQLFDLNALNDQLDRNRHHRGARPLRAVLEEHYVGGTLTESELEEGFLALCRRLRLPRPSVNRWIDLGDGGPMIRGDFVWYEQRVIVETDGARFHGTRQARERDPRRDQRAIVAGWRPVRTTWGQVMWRPRELESALLALVGARPRAATG